MDKPKKEPVEINLQETNVWVEALDDKGNVIKKESIGHNTACKGASLYVARALVDLSLISTPIKYLALGRGNPSWDRDFPPAETKFQTHLENEFIRKQVDWSFVATDGSFTRLGKSASVATNIVDVWADFDLAEVTGHFMELGLYANCTAESEPDDGLLINYKTFASRKALGFTQERIYIRLKA